MSKDNLISFIKQFLINARIFPDAGAKCICTIAFLFVRMPAKER